MGLNDDPADLTGHGPITAQLARALAFNAGSTWRRLVTDPLHGYLLNFGRTKYQPPAPLADHVRGRDRTCRGGTDCTRPAHLCELDHLVSWPAGETSEVNLGAKCKHHHRLRHEGRWTHRLSTDPADPPGTIVITSPTGHVYLSRPYDYRSISAGDFPDPGEPPF